MKKFICDIDVTGSCNLRCPSCPQGNIKGYRLPRGFMEPELLARIIRKVTSECFVERCSLFSWCEPLLHPRLPELIRIVREAGVPSYLSSNLNILTNVDAIMAENPTFFRISLSGFSQEVYGYTHRGGNIKRVKQHMLELAEAKKRHNSSTRIYVYYHRYLHNLKEEPLMRRFSTDLGFEFEPVWALFFPVEKIFSYLGEDENSFSLTAEDHELIENLAVPLGKALEAAKGNRNMPCLLRDKAISLNFEGNFTLCCGVFDASKYTLGNYLETPLDEIQRMRESHPMCNRCMAHGIHRYLIHGFQELTELALAHIAPEDAELLNLRHEIAQIHKRQKLIRIYDTLFTRILSPEKKASLADRFYHLDRFLSRLHQKNKGKG